MLLAISTVHALPETIQGYNDWLEIEKKEPGTNSWLVFVLYALGFLFMLLLDQVVFKEVEDAIEDESEGSKVEEGNGEKVKDVEL